ncbi:MAG: DUF1080 domain-containing protein [Tannerella sp.]|jgi:hypothetical protein|nr:DUF1080 domain-containing protein [Tannerella sp.]
MENIKVSTSGMDVSNGRFRLYVAEKLARMRCGHVFKAFYATTHYQIIGCALAFMLFACSQKKQETAGDARREIPEILQNHSEKASFAKLTGGNAEWIALFNGRDLFGWYTYTKKYGKNNDAENQFLVKDGALHFDGEPMGYIYTTGSYRDYYLKIVFRWGEKKYPPREDRPRDSGVMYHFPDTAKNALWPVSVECQIQEGDCGDYWLVGGTTADSPNKGVREGSQGRFIRSANFENPAPEWNTIEVICYDDKSEHYVNGHLVNQAYNLSVTEGRILLQLEASEIFYKTVDLLPLR